MRATRLISPWHSPYLSCKHATRVVRPQMWAIPMALAVLSWVALIQYRGEAIADTVEDTAAAPQVYNTPFHQSPVHAAPGDLLFLPGHGFAQGAVIAYQLAQDDQAPHAPELPHSSFANTPERGLLGATNDDGDIAYNNVPHALVVRLPEYLKSGQPYVLWARNPQGGWSRPVIINDVRPLWVTPAISYETKPLAGMAREITVIGRNLEAPVGKTTILRLEGPMTYTLPSEKNAGDRLGAYQVRAQLPARVIPGRYRVSLSRDGIHWKLATANSLTVLPNPQEKPVFNIADYGCVPDDGQDDATCIHDAIRAATHADGGTVWFPPGRWDVIDPAAVHESKRQGIFVPRGVDLVGNGEAVTIIAKSSKWRTHSLFTLQGRQKVDGIHFTEIFDGTSHTVPTTTHFFRLGRQPWVAPDDPEEVEQISFARNRFSAMHTAIGDSGRRIRNLHIVHNVFNAYQDNLWFGGNPKLPAARFNVIDSIVSHNRFLPGHHRSPSDGQGVVASRIGASTRLDFTHNVVDGAIDGGWRAAHFFHMNGNHEMLFVADNHASCTGDKGGDGEAIVFDNSGNIPAVSAMRDVVHASPNEITLDEQLGAANRELTGRDAIPGQYGEYWVQIVAGPGLGQSRKIRHYADGPRSVITVAPAWDVVPVPGWSKVYVARTFWNTYMVGNIVDIRGCRKSNPLNASGFIGWYAMTTDSTIDGNRLYDTNGITVHTHYSGVHDRKRKIVPSAMFNYTNEIHGNHIEGEFRYPSSVGGISIHYGAYRQGPAPVAGFGLTVSRNTIIRADAGLPHKPRGGIAVYNSWWIPADPSVHWRGIVLAHNRLVDIETGIYIERSVPHPSVFGTVIGTNSTTEVKHPLRDGGEHSVNWLTGSFIAAPIPATSKQAAH